MVKILKEGLYGKVLFKCSNCDCIFEVDEEECDQDWSIHSIPWTHKCPKCKNLCKSDKGCRKNK